MSGSVERWLKTFMCDKYAALFEAYGFKTLHSVCQLQPSTLHSMGIPPEHCDEILENISLIRQSIDASSPEHVVPQDAGLAYGLRHNLQSPHYTGSSYSEHGYDHQMAGHPQSNSYSYQSPGSYPSHQHYNSSGGQMSHGMPYPVSESYAGAQSHYGPPSNHDMYGPHMYNNHVHPGHGGGGGGSAWDDPTMRIYNHSPRHIMGSSPPPPPPSSLMRSPPPSSSPAGGPLPHYPRHSIMEQPPLPPAHPLPHHHPWAQGQGVSPGMMNSPRATPSPSVGHQHSSNASPAMSNCSPAHGKPFSPQPYSPHPPTSAHSSAVTSSGYDYPGSGGGPNSSQSLPPPIPVPARHPGSPSVVGGSVGSPSDPLMSLQKMVMLDPQNIRAAVHGSGHSPLLGVGPPVALGISPLLPASSSSSALSSSVARPGPKFSSVEQLAGCGTPSPCPSHVSKSNDAPSPSLASVESTGKSSSSTTGGSTPPLPLPLATPSQPPAVAGPASDGSNGPAEGHSIVTDDEGTTLLNIGLCNGARSSDDTVNTGRPEVPTATPATHTTKIEPNVTPDMVTDRQQLNFRKRRPAPSDDSGGGGGGGGIYRDYYDGDGASLLEIGCCKSEAPDMAADKVAVVRVTAGKAGRRKKLRASLPPVPENGHVIGGGESDYGSHASPRRLDPVRGNLANGPPTPDESTPRVGHHHQQHHHPVGNFTFPLEGVDRKPILNSASDMTQCDEKTLTLLSPRRNNNGKRPMTKGGAGCEQRGRQSPPEHYPRGGVGGHCGSPVTLGCGGADSNGDPAENWNLRVSSDMKFIAKKVVGARGGAMIGGGSAMGGGTMCATRVDANTWTPPLSAIDCADVKPAMMMTGMAMMDGGIVDHHHHPCKPSPRLLCDRPDTNGQSHAGTEQRSRFDEHAVGPSTPADGSALLSSGNLATNNGDPDSRPGEDDETIGSHWTESLRAHLTDTGDEESVASSDQQLWSGNSLGHFGGGLSSASTAPVVATTATAAATNNNNGSGNPATISSPCGRRPRGSGGVAAAANVAVADGSSPQAYQRKRGRPLGSKNKPRPPGFEREPPAKKGTPKKSAVVAATILGVGPTTPGLILESAVPQCADPTVTVPKPPKLTVKATEMPPPSMMPPAPTTIRKRASATTAAALVSEGTQTRKLVDVKPKGPYVHLGGASDKFLEVILSNTASAAAAAKEEEQGGHPEAKGGLVKRRTFPAHAGLGSGVGGKKKMKSVGFNSTLSANYDVFTRDKSWVCALCRTGSHYKGLGDLFGPYFEDSAGHALGVSSSFVGGSGGERKVLAVGGSGGGAGGGGGFEPMPGCSSDGDMSATRKVRARRKRSELVEEFFKTTMAKKGKKSRESVRSSSGCGPSFSPEPLREPVASTSTASATASATAAAATGGAISSSSADCPLTSSGELWAHEDCIVWSHGVYLLGNKIVGLKDAVAHAAEMVCSCCNQFGATIGCLRKGCTEKYHYICAIDKGCQLVEEHLSVLCPKHKKKLNSDT